VGGSGINTGTLSVLRMWGVLCCSGVVFQKTPQKNLTKVNKGRGRIERGAERERERPSERKNATALSHPNILGPNPKSETLSTNAEM
jgi:hypothetical protein